MRLHLQLQAQKFPRVRTGWVTVNLIQGICSASNLPGQRRSGSPGRAGTPCPPPAPARIWGNAQLGSLHPTLSGVLGKASPGRAGESRSFASGIQPSSPRASLSESLGSSQAHLAALSRTGSSAEPAPPWQTNVHRAQAHSAKPFTP